jgi:DNA/RNA-binding protein KIN17
MPKAEVGSTKWLGNKMKAKGLQRLRWYCQACEKQCRDENGFKQHTMSEVHVRNMHLIGEDPKRAIRDFSAQFKRDFLQQLRTQHNEKPVQANNFYQSYIANKEHVHMNSTSWPSLTEFVKYLGREGICRVTETDKGLFIAWIDDSPEALRRRDAIKKKERQDKGDEEREQRQIREQIGRAQEMAKEAESQGEAESKPLLSERKEGEKIVLNLFGKKPAVPEPEKDENAAEPLLELRTGPIDQSDTPPDIQTPAPETAPAKAEAPVKLSFGGSSKPKNVFSAGKKNPFGKKKAAVVEQPKKMSVAERIMHEELERKRQRDERGGGGGGGKRPRFS